MFKDLILLYNNGIRMYIKGDPLKELIIIESLAILLLTFLYFLFSALGPNDFLIYLVLLVVFILIFFLIESVVEYLKKRASDCIELRKIELITLEYGLQEIEIKKIGGYSFAFTERDFKYAGNIENKFHYEVKIDPLSIKYNKKYSFKILETEGEFLINLKDKKVDNDPTLYIDFTNKLDSPNNLRI